MSFNFKRRGSYLNPQEPDSMELPSYGEEYNYINEPSVYSRPIVPRPPDEEPSYAPQDDFLEQIYKGLGEPGKGEAISGSPFSRKKVRKPKIFHPIDDGEEPDRPLMEVATEPSISFEGIETPNLDKGAQYSYMKQAKSGEKSYTVPYTEGMTPKDFALAAQKDMQARYPKAYQNLKNAGYEDSQIFNMIGDLSNENFSRLTKAYTELPYYVGPEAQQKLNDLEAGTYTQGAKPFVPKGITKNVSLGEAGSRLLSGTFFNDLIAGESPEQEARLNQLSNTIDNNIPDLFQRGVAGLTLNNVAPEQKGKDVLGGLAEITGRGLAQVPPTMGAIAALTALSGGNVPLAATIGPAAVNQAFAYLTPRTPEEEEANMSELDRQGQAIPGSIIGGYTGAISGAIPTNTILGKIGGTIAESTIPTGIQAGIGMPASGEIKMTGNKDADDIIVNFIQNAATNIATRLATRGKGGFLSSPKEQHIVSSEGPSGNRYLIGTSDGESVSYKEATLGDLENLVLSNKNIREDKVSEAGLNAILRKKQFNNIYQSGRTMGRPARDEYMNITPSDNLSLAQGTTTKPKEPPTAPYGKIDPDAIEPLGNRDPVNKDGDILPDIPTLDLLDEQITTLSRELNNPNLTEDSRNQILIQAKDLLDRRNLAAKIPTISEDPSSMKSVADLESQMDKVTQDYYRMHPELTLPSENILKTSTPDNLIAPPQAVPKNVSRDTYKIPGKQTPVEKIKVTQPEPEVVTDPEILLTNDERRQAVELGITAQEFLDQKNKPNPVIAPLISPEIAPIIKPPTRLAKSSPKEVADDMKVANKLYGMAIGDPGQIKAIIADIQQTAKDGNSKTFFHHDKKHGTIESIPVSEKQKDNVIKYLKLLDKVYQYKPEPIPEPDILTTPDDEFSDSVEEQIPDENRTIVKNNELGVQSDSNIIEPTNDTNSSIDNIVPGAEGVPITETSRLLGTGNEPPTSNTRRLTPEDLIDPNQERIENLFRDKEDEDTFITPGSEEDNQVNENSVLPWVPANKRQASLASRSLTGASKLIQEARIAEGLPTPDIDPDSAAIKAERAKTELSRSLPLINQDMEAINEINKISEEEAMSTENDVKAPRKKAPSVLNKSEKKLADKIYKDLDITDDQDGDDLKHVLHSTLLLKPGKDLFLSLTDTEFSGALLNNSQDDIVKFIKGLRKDEKLDKQLEMDPLSEKVIRLAHYEVVGRALKRYEKELASNPNAVLPIPKKVLEANSKLFNKQGEMVDGNYLSIIDLTKILKPSKSEGVSESTTKAAKKVKVKESIIPTPDPIPNEAPVTPQGESIEGTAKVTEQFIERADLKPSIENNPNVTFNLHGTTYNGKIANMDQYNDPRQNKANLSITFNNGKKDMTLSIPRKDILKINTPVKSEESTGVEVGTNKELPGEKKGGYADPISPLIVDNKVIKTLRERFTNLFKPKPTEAPETKELDTDKAIQHLLDEGIIENKDYTTPGLLDYIDNPTVTVTIPGLKGQFKGKLIHQSMAGHEVYVRTGIGTFSKMLLSKENIKEIKPVVNKIAQINKPIPEQVYESWWQQGKNTLNGLLDSLSKVTGKSFANKDLAMRQSLPELGNKQDAYKTALVKMITFNRKINIASTGIDRSVQTERDRVFLGKGLDKDQQARQTERLWVAIQAINGFDENGIPIMNDVGIPYDNIRIPKISDGYDNAIEQALTKAIDAKGYDYNGKKLGYNDFTAKKQDDGTYRLFLKFKNNKDEYARAITGRDFIDPEGKIPLTMDNMTPDMIQKSYVDYLQTVDALRTTLATEYQIDGIDGYIHHFAPRTFFGALTKTFSRKQANVTKFRSGQSFRENMVVKDIFQSVARMRKELVQAEIRNKYHDEMVKLFSRSKEEIETGLYGKMEQYENLKETNRKLGAKLYKDAKSNPAKMEHHGIDPADAKSLGVDYMNNGIYMPRTMIEILGEQVNPQKSIAEGEGIVGIFNAVMEDIMAMKQAAVLTDPKSGIRDYMTTAGLMNSLKLMEDSAAAIRDYANSRENINLAVKQFLPSIGRHIKRDIVTPIREIGKANKTEKTPVLQETALPESSYYDPNYTGQTELGRKVLSLHRDLLAPKRFFDGLGKTIIQDQVAMELSERWVREQRGLTEKDADYKDAVMEKLQNLTDDEISEVALAAGEYTFSGELLNPMILKFANKWGVKASVGAFTKFWATIMSTGYNRINFMSGRNRADFKLETNPAKIKLSPDDITEVADEVELKLQGYIAKEQQANPNRKFREPETTELRTIFMNELVEARQQKYAQQNDVIKGRAIARTMVGQIVGAGVMGLLTNLGFFNYQEKDEYGRPLPNRISKSQGIQLDSILEKWHLDKDVHNALKDLGLETEGERNSFLVMLRGLTPIPEIKATAEVISSVFTGKGSVTDYYGEMLNSGALYPIIDKLLDKNNRKTWGNVLGETIPLPFEGLLKTSRNILDPYLRNTRKSGEDISVPDDERSISDIATPNAKSFLTDAGRSLMNRTPLSKGLEKRVDPITGKEIRPTEHSLVGRIGDRIQSGLGLESDNFSLGAIGQAISPVDAKVINETDRELFLERGLAAISTTLPDIKSRLGNIAQSLSPEKLTEARNFVNDKIQQQLQNKKYEAIKQVKEGTKFTDPKLEALHNMYIETQDPKLLDKASSLVTGDKDRVITGALNQYLRTQGIQEQVLPVKVTVETPEEVELSVKKLTMKSKLTQILKANPEFAQLGQGDELLQRIREQKAEQELMKQIGLDTISKKPNRTAQAIGNDAEKAINRLRKLEQKPQELNRIVARSIYNARKEKYHASRLIPTENNR